MNPWQLTASEGIARIRTGRLNAVEWVRSCLDRIESLEPRLHAWTFLDPEIPLRQAGQADRLRASDGSAGPLEGTPIGVKDIFNTLEMPTEMGSPLWKGFTPGNDARVVAALKRCGAIVMGKTVTSEFAVHTPGPTRNPHDPDRSPGTSSSGSAVAVATAMVPAALGSQTAGSTLRPASYCGVYGFKPSFGLIPRTGMLKTIDTLDHVALFARTPEDLCLLLDHARVSGRNYPQVQERVDPTRQAPAPSPWKVGLVRGPRWGQAQPYVRTALEKWAKNLAGLPEIQVQEFVPPAEFEKIHETHERIYCRMLAYYFQKEARHAESLSASFLRMIETGRRVSPAQYQADLRFQSEVTRLLDRRVQEEGLHLLLDFSTAGEAPRGLQTPDPADHCLLWTFCGTPALNLPLFAGPHGLPHGAQLVARRYDDYPLLRFATFLRERGQAPTAPFPSIPALRPEPVELQGARR